MERKIKIMGMYIGLLFFISILLILITSLSNSKFEPVYSNESQSVSFDSTMQQSASHLTETNQKLSDTVVKMQNKITELENEISVKESVIDEYEIKYNEDTVNFYSALKFYIQGDKKSAKEILTNINSFNLSDEDKNLYEQMLNELN